MEQFRQIGEVLGSMKAQMVFKNDIQINRRQCSLLIDIFSSAYESIAEEMVHNLRFEERYARWRILETPLKELLRIFKEGENYIRQSLESKDWWAKAITLYQNKDCVEFYIHNLLFTIHVVIEAIESAGEISGWNEGDIQNKRFIYSMKYHKEWKDPKLFQWKFGKQYLVSEDFCNRINTAWEEDRWILLNKIREKRALGLMNFSKYENGLNDLLFKNLEVSEPLNGKLLPFSILVGSKDYQVKRRLGNGSQYKEIFWLGETFVLRHFFGNIEPLVPEISQVLSLSHPNILNFFCGFTDEEKKECFLVMELMNRDLCSYIKEVCGPKRRIPFTLPVAVDLMLQIARGMEYLHSKKIYHGDLKPYNILVKAISTEGYLHAKVSGYGLSSTDDYTSKSYSNQHGAHPFIWYAPEVLLEQEQTGSKGNSRYTEKSDVYSFGMVCFELLTGKVPFEDGHLQGDKISRNIRAGERPLFPFYSPKYVTNLTKRCWHTDPNQRPSFSSICRILRYIKRFLVMNPDHSQPDAPMPLVDYCEIEAGLLKQFPSWGSPELSPITQIPFQIFAYRVVEKEKTSSSLRNNSESGSDGASMCGDENVPVLEESFPLVPEKPSVSSEGNKKLSSLKKSPDVKANKPGTPKGRLVRPPQFSPGGRTLRMNSESQLMVMSPRIRRTSGHASDSELS